VGLQRGHAEADGKKGHAKKKNIPNYFIPQPGPENAGLAAKIR
jgi:hypothetical protein